jgi:hypothetical protein
MTTTSKETRPALLKQVWKIFNMSGKESDAHTAFEDLTDKHLREIIRKKSKGGSIKRKSGGTVKRKRGGVAKKQVGGLTQGYDARLDESLAARHRGTKGNLAARRHESEGMERTLGHRPYSGARTMAKKGGSVRRKKGSTVSRRGGGKIMQGYKAGGKV